MTRATRTATLQPTASLANSTTYIARVVGGTSGVKDFAGNPLAADFVWTFNTEHGPDTDSARRDGGGLLRRHDDPGTVVSQMSDGEVILAPTISGRFLGKRAAVRLVVHAVERWRDRAVANGQLTRGRRTGEPRCDRAGRSASRLRRDVLGRYVRARRVRSDVQRNAVDHVQHRLGGALYARTHDGSTAIDTLIPGNWLGTPHRTGSTGRRRASCSPSTARRCQSPGAHHDEPATDHVRLRAGRRRVVIDWMRLAPYATSGTFTSRVLDSGSTTAGRRRPGPHRCTPARGSR